MRILLTIVVLVLCVCIWNDISWTEVPDNANDSDTSSSCEIIGHEAQSPREWLENLKIGLNPDSGIDSEKAADIRLTAREEMTLRDLQFTLENWDTLVPEDLRGAMGVFLSDVVYEYKWPCDPNGWGVPPPMTYVLPPHLFPSERRRVLPQLRALFMRLDREAQGEKILGTSQMCWPTDPVPEAEWFVESYTVLRGDLPDTFKQLQSRFGSDLTEGLFTQQELDAAIKTGRDDHPLYNALPEVRRRWHLAQEFMLTYAVCKDPLDEYVLSDERKKQVDELIAKLGSNDKETVSEARKSLVAIGLGAYGSLQKAAKEDGKPVCDEATSLLKTPPFLIVEVAKLASEKYSCNQDILLLEYIADTQPGLKVVALERLAQICPDALGGDKKWVRYEYTEWYKKYADYAVWDNDSQRWKIQEQAFKAEIPLGIWDSVPWPESVKSDNDRATYWEKLTAYEQEGLAEWAWFKKYEKENEKRLKENILLPGGSPQISQEDALLYEWFLHPRDIRARWNKFGVDRRAEMERDAVSAFNELRNSKEELTNLMDAIQHGIDYAVWMQLPEDTRKKWDSLDTKDKEAALAPLLKQGKESTTEQKPSGQNAPKPSEPAEK